MISRIRCPHCNNIIDLKMVEKLNLKPKKKIMFRPKNYPNVGPLNLSKDLSLSLDKKLPRLPESDKSSGGLF